MKELLDEISAYCIKHHETIAVAESVTAGNVQCELSRAENAQQFFQGGITVYNCGQKMKHLNIDPILGERFNGVSLPIAEEMAENCCRLFCSSIGIAVTGYAAPVPELDVQQPYAYFTITQMNKWTVSEKIVPEATDFADIQEEYTRHIIRSLRSLLNEKTSKTTDHGN